MQRQILRFGHFEVHLDRYELRKGTVRIRLGPQPMELLILLARRPGELVTREEIAEKLWSPGIFLDAERGINNAMRRLRTALGDNPGQPQYVETVAGKGYRFVALVEATELAADAGASVAIAPASVAAPQSTPEGLSSPAPEMPPDQKPTQPLAPARWRMVTWRSAAAILALLAFVVLGAYFLGGVFQRRQIRSVAVLPLRNLSNDPEQEYFADGMTDVLITDLARIGSFRVVSHTSVRLFKGSQRSLVEIARALKVDAVVEGTVLRGDGRLRITAQLLDARTDHHLWAQTYDRTVGDALEVQQEVARAISGHIAATLNLESPKKAVHSGTANPVAFESYLRGRFFWNKRTLEDLQKAVANYRGAIEQDGSYAEAYAALGETYVLLSFYGGPPPSECFPLAREAAQKALRLQDLAEAHTVLAAVATAWDWNWTVAETEFRRAIELNHGYSTAHHWFSLHLSRMGRIAEAKAEIARALQLDPLSLIVNVDAGETLYWAREPDQAIERMRRALELDPNFAAARAALGKAYEQKKNFAEAIVQFELASRLTGDNSKMSALRAHALALAGRRAEAGQELARLLATAGRRYVAGPDIAFVYCALGDRKNAMNWLRQARQKREEGLNVLAIEPLFDGCRSDPEFTELLKQLRLKKQTTAASLINTSSGSYAATAAAKACVSANSRKYATLPSFIFHTITQPEATGFPVARAIPA